MGKNGRYILGEYVIAENPIEGRVVCVHYSDGSQTIVKQV